MISLERLKEKLNRDVLETAVRTRLIHWAVLIPAGLFAAGLFVFQPLSGQLKAAQAEAGLSKARVTKIEMLAQGETSFEGIARRLREEISDLRHEVLGVNEQARVIDLITGAAEDHHMSIREIQSIAEDRKALPEPAAAVRPVRFDIHLAGRYREFGEFLETLRERKLLLTVESFTLEPQNESSPVLDIRLILAAYEQKGMIS